MPIAVSIVEDHTPFREHLIALIGGADGFRVTGAHATAELALKKIPFEKPEVILADLELPGMSGIELIRALKTKLPAAEILVLTVHAESDCLFNALEAGASGYLVKPSNPTRVIEAIREMHGGGSPMSSQVARLVVKAFHQRGGDKTELSQLTKREKEVLELLARGYASKEIADALHIAVRTVGTHLHHVYKKLHVRSRAAAASKFSRAHHSAEGKQ